MVVDALYHKTIKGSLDCLSVSKGPLTKKMQTMACKFITLGILKDGRVLASIED